ncbi:MAG TPA: phosphoenolpyruvate--protein phosphotransferase [Thermomicrobiales bacterium]|nr:phosphoenolpyruvate--protein phosphotransferase [Thermomicrobiales bacterium]
MSGETLSGTPAAEGIGIGTIVVYRRQPARVERPPLGAGGVEPELERFRAAVEQTRQRLAAARQTTAARAGQQEAAIFDAQAMFLDDPAFVGEIERTIRDKHDHAESAIGAVTSSVEAMFAELEDDYLRARAADVRDVATQLLQALAGPEAGAEVELPHDAIVVADELFPSDTTLMDVSRLAGIATERGSTTAHVAILARALGIPTVVGVADLLQHVTDGQVAIVDGDAGQLVLSPDDTARAVAEARIAAARAEEERLAADRDLPAMTLDGEQVELQANIGTPAEAEVALARGAEGVGLFRTEFLFVDQPELPDEEAQCQAYRRAAEVMGERPVIIRTLDAGGDKPLPGITDAGAAELNPFLGVRGLRISLAHPDLFRTQLRALLRAATAGNIWIMFPMVATVGDVHEARRYVEGVARDLASEGVAHRADVPLGIMIEIPSAAIAIDRLIGEVDFVSIGTNDLVQYTLAVDRTNPALAAQYPAFDVAVLRLIRDVLATARAAGKHAGICGEMAGDPAAIPLLIGLGARELSMGSARLAAAKKLVRETDSAEARREAEARLA